MGDPLGWEALTQQEAEQDARAMLLAQRALEELERALAVAVRERDQARMASCSDDRAALSVGENATEGET